MQERTGRFIVNSAYKRDYIPKNAYVQGGSTRLGTTSMRIARVGLRRAAPGESLRAGSRRKWHCGTRPHIHGKTERQTQSGPYPEMWSGGILAFSPSKWCILMHSGARFRPTRQKGRPRNFCVDFSGGRFNPRNPPLNTGLEAINRSLGSLFAKHSYYQ